MASKTKCLNHPLVLRSISFLWAGFLILLLSSCGGGSGATGNSAEKSGQGQSEAMVIANALYFDKRIPEGFYQEPSDSTVYRVTTHVKNTDLLPLANRTGQPVYELASDDFNEALTWSEQAAVLQPIYRQLVDNGETALYRQFTRVDPDSPDVVYLQRILRASVIDRNGVTDRYKGRITSSTMNAEDIKRIIEYLWTFTVNNNFGTAVLSSDITETDTGFVHVMKQARLNMSNNDSCDSIEVYRVTYTVSRSSGFINKDEALERIILAKRSGNILEICQP